MIKTVIGIDPGEKGGIAIIGSNQVAVYPYSDTNLKNVANTYRNNPTVTAVVEKVHAMPQQGVTSMFSFGRAAGYIDGVLGANNIPITHVPPQIWKKYFGLLKHGKNASIAMAWKLYPDICLRKSPRCKVDSDGMAEALLIAHYGYMTR